MVRACPFCEMATCSSDEHCLAVTGRATYIDTFEGATGVLLAWAAGEYRDGRARLAVARAAAIWLRDASDWPEWDATVPPRDAQALRMLLELLVAAGLRPAAPPAHPRGPWVVT